MRSIALICGLVVLALVGWLLAEDLRVWLLAQGFHWWHGMLITAVVAAFVEVSHLRKEVNALRQRLEAAETRSR